MGFGIVLAARAELLMRRVNVLTFFGQWDPRLKQFASEASGSWASQIPDLAFGIGAGFGFRPARKFQTAALRKLAGEDFGVQRIFEGSLFGWV